MGAALNTKDRPILCANPLPSKSLKDLRRGLVSMIVEVEHVWRGHLVNRVHGDREGGLEGCQDDLRAAGIYSALTQGYDSQTNGMAENAIGVLTNGARARLLAFSDQDASEATLAML